MTFLALAVRFGNIVSITLPRDEVSPTTLYFLASSFFSCCKTAGLRALFHPSGSAPRQYDFAMRMDSELPTTSASSLSIRGYQPPSPYRLAYIQTQSTPSYLPSSSSATRTAHQTNTQKNTHLGSNGIGPLIHRIFRMHQPPPGPQLCSQIQQARLSPLF